MLNKITELALCRAVPDQFIDEMNPCRLQGLYKKLIKEIDKDLAKLPGLSDTDLITISERIERFGTVTGWLNGTRHTGTLLSFCADMLERSEYKHNPQILETINQIIEHLENGGHLKTSCCWAGSIAADKWDEVLSEE